MKPTQQNLADSIGVTQQMISAIIRGECRPIYQKAKKLEKITGIKKEIWLEASGEVISSVFRDWQIRVTIGSNPTHKPVKSHSLNNAEN